MTYLNQDEFKVPIPSLSTDEPYPNIDKAWSDILKQHPAPRLPVTEWRSVFCRFAWHSWTSWLINYDPPSPQIGWSRQRRMCVTCGRHQEASLL